MPLGHVISKAVLDRVYRQDRQLRKQGTQHDHIGQAPVAQFFGDLIGRQHNGCNVRPVIAPIDQRLEDQ